MMRMELMALMWIGRDRENDFGEAVKYAHKNADKGDVDYIAEKSSALPTYLRNGLKQIGLPATARSRRPGRDLGTGGENVPRGPAWPGPRLRPLRFPLSAAVVRILQHDPNSRLHRRPIADDLGASESWKRYHAALLIDADARFDAV
jgi:hypothetical protein